MITKINYDGYFVNNFSLEKIQDTNGGRYVTKYIEQKVEVYERKENYQPFAYKIEIELKAFNGAEEDANLAYILNVNFDVKFVNNNEDVELPDDFFIENEWFFQKYTFLATKSIIENLLNKTSLEGLRLPYA